MHDFLKFHYNCDAYMGVQKERKSTFLTAFEHREKRLAALKAFKESASGSAFIFLR